MKDFIIKLSLEINHVISLNKSKDRSFKDFLNSISHESLVEYYDNVCSATHGEKQDELSLQKAITLYLLIVKKIEKPEDDSFEIDTEYIWISALAGFITAEMFYRDGLIDGYDGFLYDGNVNFKSNGKLEEFIKCMNL